MIAVLEGTDPGRVHWPQETIDEAKNYGLALDEKGDMVEISESGD